MWFLPILFPPCISESGLMFAGVDVAGTGPIARGLRRHGAGRGACVGIGSSAASPPAPLCAQPSGLPPYPLLRSARKGAKRDRDSAHCTGREWRQWPMTDHGPCETGRCISRPRIEGPARVNRNGRGRKGGTWPRCPAALPPRPGAVRPHALSPRPAAGACTGLASLSSESGDSEDGTDSSRGLARAFNRPWHPES